jgi:hypothetical protein
MCGWIDNMRGYSRQVLRTPFGAAVPEQPRLVTAAAFDGMSALSVQFIVNPK